MQNHNRTMKINKKLLIGKLNRAVMILKRVMKGKYFLMAFLSLLLAGCSAKLVKAQTFETRLNSSDHLFSIEFTNDKWKTHDVIMQCWEGEGHRVLYTVWGFVQYDDAMSFIIHHCKTYGECETINNNAYEGVKQLRTKYFEAYEDLDTCLLKEIINAKRKKL